MNRVIAFISLLALGVLCGSVRAQNFAASLDVNGAARHGSTDSKKPHDQTLSKRTQFEVAVGEKLTIRWKVTCTTHDAQKDVLVHFYVVPIAKAGQAAPPLDPKVVVMESALTMDFTNGTSSSAEMSFMPERSGVYLVTIEIPDQQTAAALDLTVK